MTDSYVCLWGELILSHANVLSNIHTYKSTYNAKRNILLTYLVAYPIHIVTWHLLDCQVTLVVCVGQEGCGMIPMCQAAPAECLPWFKLRYILVTCLVGKALSLENPS